MPWFAEQYESPSRRWQELFNDILAQAADPARPMTEAPDSKTPPQAGAAKRAPATADEE
jgi:hypothetical protein